METMVKMGEFGMAVDVLFMFLGIALLSGLNCKNAAVGMIKELGTRPEYDPKHYVAPKRWMKKLFDIRQRAIPRYLYFELYLSFFFFALGPLNIGICIVTGFDKTIAGILIQLHVGLILINTLFYAILSTIYKKK